MNIVILLSGGVSTRMQSDIPKQYISVNDKMIITYSLQKILEAEFVDEVYIVAEEKWKKAILKDLSNSGIDAEKIKGFALPGENRQLSILNGLECAIAGGRDKLANVMIHDAARPLVTTEQLRECFEMMEDYDGVIPVLPMKDTIYFSENGSVISSLLEREKLFAGQAPECFKLKKYYEANIRLLPDEILSINGSTEPAVKAGMNIKMINGDENNFKITTQADLERFKNMV